MKVVTLFAAVVLASFGAVGRTDVPGTIDDPPPEPLTCPLCAGDPMLHVTRTFAIVQTGVDLTARALRW